jgi:uncharacterized protein involved in exopolysaccharide biosynthesis
VQHNENQDKETSHVSEENSSHASEDSSHVSRLTSHVNSSHVDDEDEINLLDYIIVLAKRKKLILSITFGAAVITAIISLIMTPIYRAETKILPPAGGSSSALALLGQMGGGLSDLAGGVLGVKTPADLYIGLAKSRTVTDRIIDRFHLMELYSAKYMVDARRQLSENVLSASADKKSGLITLSVEDKDPQRAADMANAFVDELNNLNKGLAITESAQRRLFFEDQLNDTKTALAEAEEAMKGFQEKTGVLQVEEQAKAVIEGIAAFRGQIAAKEVELRVMRTYSTPNNPDLQMAEAALKGMKSELGKLESRAGTGHDPLMPTGRMPEVGLEYMRKLRDLKFNETLFEIMTKQYELAKLDEAKEATLIQIVDRAVPPDKRVRPKRTLMVLIAAFMGFFLSVFVAFFLEYKEKAAGDPETRERFETLKKYIRIKRQQ